MFAPMGEIVEKTGMSGIRLDQNNCAISRPPVNYFCEYDESTHIRSRWHISQNDLKKMYLSGSPPIGLDGLHLFFCNPLQKCYKKQSKRCTCSPCGEPLYGSQTKILERRKRFRWVVLEALFIRRSSIFGLKVMKVHPKRPIEIRRVQLIPFCWTISISNISTNISTCIYGLRFCRNVRPNGGDCLTNGDELHTPVRLRFYRTKDISK